MLYEKISEKKFKTLQCCEALPTLALSFLHHPKHPIHHACMEQPHLGDSRWVVLGSERLRCFKCRLQLQQPFCGFEFRLLDWIRRHLPL